MSEIFNTVFYVVNTVREKASSCKNSKNILDDFERRAEDAPTLLSQGLTQALTFYLYKVEGLTALANVYDWLFENKGNDADICKSLDNSQGYLLYTSVLFYLLQKLNVECKIEEFRKNAESLKNCLTNISVNEAKVYRKLINYVIELKKISKIMLGEEKAQSTTQS